MEELDYYFSGDGCLKEDVRAEDKPVNFLTFDPESWRSEGDEGISDNARLPSQLEIIVLDRISVSDKTICDIVLVIQIIDITCELYLRFLVRWYNFLITL